jgi:integrase
MPKRRANGEGTIYQRPNGTWAGQITINGRRQTVYGRRQKDVVEKLKELQKQVLTGAYVDPQEITVTQWFYTWLDVYTKPNVSRLTYNNYKQIIDKYIVPNFGDIKLQQLQPEQLQKLYNSLANDKFGILAALYVVVGSGLKLAVKHKIISVNPDTLTKHIPIKLKRRKALSQDELEKFLEEAQKEFVYPLILLTLETGLRRGELIGLKWSDIDLENKMLAINREIEYVKMDDGKYHLVETKPKTPAAYRTVPIPDDVIPVLENYKKLYDLWVRVNNVQHDYVFITSNGTPLNPTCISKTIKRIAKKVGLEDASLHTLRHTYATKLAEKGIHPRVAQAFLGHAKVLTTLSIYTDVSKKMIEEARSKMQNFLKDQASDN